MRAVGIAKKIIYLKFTTHFQAIGHYKGQTCSRAIAYQYNYDSHSLLFHILNSVSDRFVGDDEDLTFYFPNICTFPSFTRVDLLCIRVGFFAVVPFNGVLRAWLST